MKLGRRTILMAVALYVVQVGAAWGFIEGYTYFKGDNLKILLGSYWILIYILPIITTCYILYDKSIDKMSAREVITTQGNYSPGKVGGDYAVEQSSEYEDQTRSTKEEPEERQQDTLTVEPRNSIKTKGNYSPGIVKGDYKVEK